VHNVSRWPNLRHLDEPLGGAEGLLEAVGFKKAEYYEEGYVFHTLISVKLYYTDTGYGHVVQHHQRTSSQQFYNLLYNRCTTNGQNFVR